MKPQHIETLKSEIVCLVKDYWRNKESPMLLSVLGGEKSGQIAHDLKSINHSLNDFIKYHLSDKIKVHRDKNNPIRIGAFPISATRLDNFSAQEYFDQSEKSDSSINRYNHAVWAAFRVPLAPKSKRYVDLTNGISFDDVNGEDKPDSVVEKFEVKRKYIKSKKGETPELISESIQSWAKDNSIAISKLLTSARQRNQKSLVTMLFESLTEDELARVSMPLSIVKKLSTKLI